MLSQPEAPHPALQIPLEIVVSFKRNLCDSMWSAIQRKVDQNVHKALRSFLAIEKSAFQLKVG